MEGHSRRPFCFLREGNGHSTGRAAAGVDAVRPAAAFLLRNQALFKQNLMVSPALFHGLSPQPLIAGLPFAAHGALHPPDVLIV